jgi:hypothetical protein
MVLIALVALLGLVAPRSSNAAGAVHFDPESPAGKEYALPLDEARHEATGTEGESPEGSANSGAEGESSESAPLFGEGVSGGGGGATAGQGQPGAPEKGGSKPSGSGAPQGPSGHSGPGGQAPEGNGGYPVLAGIGLAALIVLVGLGAGLGLRSLRRVRPT